MKIPQKRSEIAGKYVLIALFVPCIFYESITTSLYIYIQPSFYPRIYEDL
jgi:hypothetical protein